jgi:hypothetical protein
MDAAYDFRIFPVFFSNSIFYRENAKKVTIIAFNCFLKLNLSMEVLGHFHQIDPIVTILILFFQMGQIICDLTRKAMALTLNHFKSLGFEGWAKFVPFGENPEDYLSQELEVEISYKNIVGLHVCKHRQQKVEPLEEKFSYHVCGEVKTISHHKG